MPKAWDILVFGGAYHMFGMTADGVGGPLCHAQSMGRTPVSPSN